MAPVARSTPWSGPRASLRRRFVAGRGRGGSACRGQRCRGCWRRPASRASSRCSFTTPLARATHRARDRAATDRTLRAGRRARRRRLGRHRSSAAGRTAGRRPVPVSGWETMRTVGLSWGTTLEAFVAKCRTGSCRSSKVLPLTETPASTRPRLAAHAGAGSGAALRASRPGG